MSKDQNLLKRLDSLMQGIQIIDFDWKYVYLNDIMSKQSKVDKSELLGFTIMDKYPGIEDTPLFETLKKTMHDRKTRTFENKFTYPDNSVRWFDLRVEAAEQGIFVFSLDITKHKKSELKIAKTSRLYAFLSQINQNIVHIDDEKSLFENSCRIATQFGKFKMAWIGLLNADGTKLELVAQNGIHRSDIDLFLSITLEEYDPHAIVFQTGSYYICNDIVKTLEQWKPFAAKNGIGSAILLPIKKMGKTIGVFNIYAGKDEFSDEDEIALLKEVSHDISFAIDKFENARKHREAEISLAKSEQQFRHTLDNMIEGAQINDFDWKYLYVNDALLKLVPFEAEDLIGKRAPDIFPNIENTAFFKMANRSMRERISQTFETEFYFPDGTKGYYEIKITPIPEGIFLLSVDRTEQKKNKENVLKINRLYSFLSAINQNIVHSGNESELLEKTCKIATEIGKFKIAWIGFENPEQTRLDILCIKGNENSSLGQYSGIDFTTPNWEKLPAGKALTSGKYAVSNDVLIDPILRPYYEQFNANGIQSAIALPLKKFGKTVGVFGIQSTVKDFFDEEEIALLEEAAGDVSYAMEQFEKEKLHKKTEDLVLKNEKRFRALIEKSPVMKTLTTIEGNVIYGSPSIMNELGYNPQEFINLPISEFIHPEDVPDFVDKRIEILSEERKTVQFELRCRHKNGEWIWCGGTLTNMLHESGVNAVVANFMNISDRKKAELKLENQNKELIKINRELDRFVYSVSHDLRSPLTSVQGLATFIESESHEENTLKHVKMICDSINRMDDFIKNIVSYSRNNRTGLDIEPFDIKKVIGQVLENMRKNERARDIRFDISINQHQPFFSDRLSFITIVENVISNAVKFHKSDCDQKLISIYGTIEEGVLKLKISDNGTGIPEIYHEKIFDMFFRISGKVEGSGIGLYIVREIIEKLKGNIRVESEEHVGTSIFITLKNLNHG